MFDEACYNTAWGTMDKDFRKGRYNLVQGSPQNSYMEEYSQTLGHRPNPYASRQHETATALPRHLVDRNPMIYGSTGRLNLPSSRSYIASRSTQLPLTRNPPSYTAEKPNKFHSTSNLYFNDDSSYGGGQRTGTPTRYAAERYETEREFSRNSNGSGPERHLIFDGSTSLERRNESRNEWQPEKAFLGEIQRELEHQRRNLSGEVDKLLLPMNDLSVKQTPLDTDKNSFVDTGSGKPIFKAFVDVSDYPEDSVKIRLDSIAKKIVVEAGHLSPNSGSLSSTFTQKIALPRYADETKMDAKLNNKGIVKIEIPLLFYFPEDELKGTLDRKSKTFVNGVNSTPGGKKEVEIIVKIGNEVHPNDLRVEVLRDKLSVYTQRGGGDQKRVINTYRLPPGSDVTAITSQRLNDGQLVIRVPVGV